MMVCYRVYMNRREMQKEETRAEILRVSEELFTSRGFEHTSIQQIADGCGMTKGALYHHFLSKEEVLEEICRSHYQFLLREAEPFIQQKSLPWLKRIGLILNALRDANMSKREIAGEYLKVREAAGEGKLGERLASYDKEFYISVIAPILNEARTSGDAGFKGSAELLSVFIYHMDKAVTEKIAALARAGEESMAAEIRIVLETLMYSLSALIGVEAEKISSLLNIPETISFFRQLNKNTTG